MKFNSDYTIDIAKSIERTLKNSLPPHISISLINPKERKRLYDDPIKFQLGFGKKWVSSHKDPYYDPPNKIGFLIENSFPKAYFSPDYYRLGVDDYMTVVVAYPTTEITKDGPVTKLEDYELRLYFPSWTKDFRI